MADPKGIKGTQAPRGLIWPVRWLALIAGGALISTGECEAIFIAIFIFFFLLGLKVAALPRLARFLSVVQPGLATLAFLMALVDFLYLSKSFLLSIAHFLLMLQALQLLLLRTPRENLGGILISSLMILSASTLAIEWTYFVFLCLYLPVLIWTLMIHTLVMEREQSLLPPASSGLEWRHVTFKLRGAALLALSSALICCLVVFIFFPRFNFQGFRGQFLQPVKKTGFTNQVELGGSRKIYEDNTVVMRVELDASDKAKWPGYIRGGTLEVFDGRIWKKAPATPTRVYAISPGQIRLPQQERVKGPLLQQKIYLESMDSPLLFAVSKPSVFHIDRPMLEIFPDGSIQRILGDAWRVHYSVDSVLTPFSIDPPSTYATPFPEKGFSRLRKRAQEITATSLSASDKARLLTAYLQKNFKYDLDSGIEPSNPNPIEAFLFETGKGHCEYFASSLCLMLRSLGVPARMVTGFYSSEWNTQGHYIIVRMRHAHAWVEAYMEGTGWVSMDPTPSEYRGGAQKTGGAGSWVQMWDYMNLRWNRYILSYDFEKQKSLFESVSRGSNQFSLKVGRILSWFRMVSFHSISLQKHRSRLEGSVRQVTRVAFIGISGGAFLVGVFILVFYLSKRRRSKTAWFYDPLIKYLGKQGARLDPKQTLSELIETTSHMSRIPMTDVLFLRDQYHQVRFGRHAFISDENTLKIRLALKRLK